MYRDAVPLPTGSFASRYAPCRSLLDACPEPGRRALGIGRLAREISAGKTGFAAIVVQGERRGDGRLLRRARWRRLLDCGTPSARLSFGCESRQERQQFRLTIVVPSTLSQSKGGAVSSSRKRFVRTCGKKWREEETGSPFDFAQGERRGDGRVLRRARLRRLLDCGAPSARLSFGCESRQERQQFRLTIVFPSTLSQSKGGAGSSSRKRFVRSCSPPGPDASEYKQPRGWFSEPSPDAGRIASATALRGARFAARRRVSRDR